MRSFNILFTGVGRRVELIQLFQQAAVSLNIIMKIYGADMSDTAPALAYCDYTRRVCSMRDADYITQLLQICEQDRINMLIPTIDTDLMILSRSKHMFEQIGTRVLISTEDKIALCRDKNLTGAFFECCGLLAPKSFNDYTKYNGGFPCFIKPKDGSSSINAFKVHDPEQLQTFAKKVQDYVIQPFVDGTEYTIDIMCDLYGNPITIVPRERLAVRSGEVLKTRIDLDEKLISEGKKIVDKFKPCGPITVQAIRDRATSKDYFIEINPRFGGGAPLSMKAGADSAAGILKLLSGLQVKYHQEDLSNGAVYSRFDQSVCIDRGEDRIPIKGVIFDLDDTLYPEVDYVKSGFAAVAEYLGDRSIAEFLWSYFEKKLPAIDEYLKETHQEGRKNELLTVYREHTPNIKLYDWVFDKIEELKLKGIKVGIITDGRVSGQKKKIKALGLERVIDDIIITDELGGEQFRKPCDIAFRIMQRRWKIPFERLVYFGDNPNKDSHAPRQLGMKFVLIDNPNGLYSFKGK